MAAMTRPRAQRGRNSNATLWKTITTLASVAIVSVFFFPILFWILASFKPFTDIFVMPPVLFGFRPILTWYRIVLGGVDSTANELEQRGGVTTGGGSYYSVPFLRDSIIIAVVSTLIVVLVAALAAYALSRFQFRRQQDFVFWIVSTRMMPAAAAVLPFFIMYRSLGLIDTYTGVIIVHAVANLPLAVLLMRSFFDEVPRELDEAAMVDGTTRFGAFFKVILHYVWPGIAAAAILCFIFSWNEFLLTLTLTKTHVRTLPVAASTFDSQQGTEWGMLAALGTTAMIPVFIFVLFVQKHLVRGLTMGAIKG